MIKDRTILAGLLFFFSLASSFPTFADSKPQPGIDKEAIIGLIERIAPAHTQDFIIETLPYDNNAETFEIEGRDAKIVLRGNSTLALSRAFNWYLNNYLPYFRVLV